MIIATAVFLIPSTFAWYNEAGSIQGELEYTFVERQTSSFTFEASSSITSFTGSSTSGKLLGCMNASQTFGEVQLSKLDKFELTASKWVNSYSTQKPSGATPNAITLTGIFNCSENNVYCTEIEITPKNDSSSADIATQQATNYVIYSNPNGSTAKTLLDNNAFSYYTGSEIKPAVITQDGYFEGVSGKTYNITAVIWLDGFAPALAECGAVDVKITLGKVSDFYASATTTSSGDGVSDLNITTNGQVKNLFKDVEHLRIPPAYYKDSTLVETKIVYNNAFKDKTCLKYVYIPDTVTEVKEYSFSGCTNLESVNFGNSVTRIGYSSFVNNSSLTSATFNNPYNWKVNNKECYIEAKIRTPQEVAGWLIGQGNLDYSNVGGTTQWDWKASGRTAEGS